MRYSTKQIEDLLVAKVAAGLTYLRTVDSYENKYDLELERLVHRSPMVLVSLDSIKPAEELGTFAGQGWLYIFNLGIVCRDLRGPKEGRRGEEGAYEVIDDLYDLLEGHRLAQGLEPLEREAVEFVMSTNVGVVYRAAYSLTQVGG